MALFLPVSACSFVFDQEDVLKLKKIKTDFYLSKVLLLELTVMRYVFLFISFTAVVGIFM